MSDYPGMGRIMPQLPGDGLTVLDGEGRIRDDVVTILDVCADADVAVATGHLSLAEIRALQDAAVSKGVRKFIVTHANWALCKLDLDVQRELISKGAYLEYVSVSVVSPIFHEQHPSELARWIDDLSGDHLFFGSDLGQFAGPPQPEGLRMLFAALLGEGVPFDELEKMSKANPAHLLGLS